MLPALRILFLRFLQIWASCHVAAASARSATEGCPAACAELAVRFGSALHYPGDDNFTMWDGQQQEVTPACRVEPSSSADVGTIMKIVVAHWCTFAVKSGGHSSKRGASNSDGGVTVDLDRISTVELSDDLKTARVGSGANWLHVYEALEQSNLTTVGSRVSMTGVGGFFLGGGISFLSPKYGWGADNIMEFELVLPNATVVNAREDHHPELYFALRGGGNDFGIVTYFTVKTYEDTPMFGGQLAFTEDKEDALLRITHDLTTTRKEDSNLAFYYTMAYVERIGQVLCGLHAVYLEPTPDPAPYAPLRQLEPIANTTRVTSMKDLTVEVTKMMTNGTRHVGSTLTFFPSTKVEKQSWKFLREYVASLKHIRGLTVATTYHPLGINVLRAMKQRGGNAIGIDYKGPLTILDAAFTWHDPKDDLVVRSAAREYTEKVKAVAQGCGVDTPFLYMNYASEWQDVWGGYNQNNVAELREIQKSIDPRGVFTEEGLCNVYFKLS